MPVENVNVSVTESTQQRRILSDATTVLYFFFLNFLILWKSCIHFENKLKFEKKNKQKISYDVAIDVKLPATDSETSAHSNLITTEEKALAMFEDTTKLSQTTGVQIALTEPVTIKACMYIILFLFFDFYIMGYIFSTCNIKTLSK